MKKLALLVITTALLVLVAGTVPTLTPTALAQQPENRVGAQFGTYWIYDSPEDTFTSSEVTGKCDWHANVGTGAPVPGVTLTLDSTLNFDKLKKENLITVGPPTYVWSFGDITPGAFNDAYVGFAYLDSPGLVPVTFNPGFDASRSADRTEFSAPGTQTLTITLTPRETTEKFHILIHADESDLVNPVITSPTSGEGIELRQEEHWLHIHPTNLQLDTTWTITVTIQVTPKVPEVEYMPDVNIGWNEPLDSSTASGSSFSFRVADMGTWTISAKGSYEWDWTDELIRQVSWNSYSEREGEGSRVDIPEGNLVQVHFIEEYHCRVSEDSFINREVLGERWWRTNMLNETDETGAPVTELKLTLDNEMSFEGLGKGIGRDHLTTMGPPTYEWFLGDISDGETVVHPGGEWPWDAWVSIDSTKMTGWQPQPEVGYDVSRSFDKTEFSAPGIQTMTITVIPREESIDEISIFVHTYENDTVNPVVTSYSCANGGDISIEQEGHRSGIHWIPVELDTPVTIIVTIEVTPKVDLVNYKASTSIYPVHLSTPSSSGITVGSSVSCTNDAGTWTWSADGEYVWQWSGPEYRPDGVPSVSVHFSESSSQSVSSLPVSIFIYSGISILIVLAGLIIYKKRRKSKITNKLI